MERCISSSAEGWMSSLAGCCEEQGLTRRDEGFKVAHNIRNGNSYAAHKLCLHQKTRKRA